ncbi:tripartite tricarboxylate transporter permease [Salinarimonas rosea]|uniref:tripartite tricarboxylate transporter permease n=1 Tax=Salinarimonas rosea TaxID=552063 RepID=UPI00041E6056|nr:tripartite tricarboxylate transporter permease [Salinarimonas rosea]
MLEHIVPALSALLEPVRLLALFAGMFAGLVFGMLPGLGGVAAVSILLPFIYLFDSYAGLALLLGATSVIYTSDTITSVLVGAPGSPASAPTAIEGHALARQGKAATALGVGFLASMVGGLFGAVILSLAIPVAGPLVLALGTPELLMFAVVGLVFAAGMVGKDIAVGLAAAAFGILLGTIGAAPAAVDFRFTFGQPYLADGISLTIVALGLFAVAEVVGMLASGGGISNERLPLGSWREGARAFVAHRWLIVRSALIGVFGGFVPAVGASASTWIAYGHAMRSTKDKSRFGKGDIRGLAAAEGANNATVISDLVPTLLFSVPGGPAAAVFLGALFSFGFYPGPRLVRENPELMYVIVWSVAIASVVGAVICFAITPLIARLTRIRFAIIAAPLLLIMVAGAYQATQSFGDIAMLLTLGVVGWLMKQADWPRAPVLVGFVLAKPMEQYFWLTVQIHGWSWLLRPGVLVIGALIVIPLLLRLAGHLRARRSRAAAAAAAGIRMVAPLRKERRTDTRIGLAVAWLILVVFVYAAFETAGFAPDSRLLPMLAIAPGLILGAFVVVRETRRALGEGVVSDSAAVAEIPYLLTILAYGVGIWLVGFDIATIALLIWMLIGCARMRLATGIAYAALILATIHGMFVLMRVSAPAGLLDLAILS